VLSVWEVDVFLFEVMQDGIKPESTDQSCDEEMAACKRECGRISFAVPKRLSDAFSTDAVATERLALRHG
jgi:hypothetical protein